LAAVESGSAASIAAAGVGDKAELSGTIAAVNGRLPLTVALAGSEELHDFGQPTLVSGSECFGPISRVPF
jgi:hypothetical protein